MECEEYGDDGKRPLAAFHASTPSRSKKDDEFGTTSQVVIEIIASLRTRRERPRSRRAAEQRYELAAPHLVGHSITSSASARSLSGTAKASAFAVFILITSSNLTACITGRSAGFVPRRILAA